MFEGFAMLALGLMTSSSQLPAKYTARSLPYTTNSYTFYVTALNNQLESPYSAPCYFTNWQGGTNKVAIWISLAWDYTNEFTGFNLYAYGTKTTNMSSTTNKFITYWFNGQPAPIVRQYSCIGVLKISRDLKNWTVTNNPYFVTNWYEMGPIFFKGTNVTFKQI